MSAAETLAAADAAGLRLTVDGADLVVEANRPPPPALIEALRRDKPRILRLIGDDVVTRDMMDVLDRLYAEHAARLGGGVPRVRLSDWRLACNIHDELRFARLRDELLAEGRILRRFGYVVPAGRPI